MRTNIEIDDALMTRALEASGLPTKRAVVEEALRLLIRIEAGRHLIDLAGKVEFFEDYDPEEGDPPPVEWDAR
ncbi:MAG: type II toxin-antitoxin system VapB family antitoxin [Tepidiformaceae bacterium]